MIRCHVHPFHADFRYNFVYSYIVNLTNFHRIKLPQFTFIHFKISKCINFYSLLLGLVNFLDIFCIQMKKNL